IYSILANSDIPFPTLTLPSGEEVRIDSQGYDRLRSSPDRELRKQVFDAFWGNWLEYRNGSRKTLNSHIKTHMALTKASKCQSMRHRQMIAYNLPEDDYRTLVDKVNITPTTLHRYCNLRRRIHREEQKKSSDTYPPLQTLN